MKSSSSQVSNYRSFAFVLLLLFNLNGYGQSSIKLPWFHFDWETADMGGRTIEKSAILLPFKIEQMPYQFKAQFDLGATTTMLYGKAMSPYLERYPQIQNKLDTTLKVLIEGSQHPSFRSLTLTVDKVRLPGINVGYFSNFGQTMTADSVNTPSVKLVGTIAGDICRDKVLIIDFPHQQMCVTQSIPAAFKSARFVQCRLMDGRLMIPFSINGKVAYVMFDTGSSLSSLLTHTSNLHDVSLPGAPDADSLMVSTWGRQHMLYFKEITAVVKVGDKTLGKGLVDYEDDPNLAKFLESENLWGITGNKYFLNNTVIIDYKHKLFAVL